MASLTRASRSISGASYTETEALPVKNTLAELRTLLSTADEIEVDQEHVKSCLAQIKLLQTELSVKERPNTTQDAFRAFNGFQTVLDLVKSCTRIAEQGSHGISGTELLLQAIGLLRDSLQGHWGNKRYFSRKVNYDGWLSLQHELDKYLAVVHKKVVVRILGELLATSVEDETLLVLLENLKIVEDTQDTPEHLVKIVATILPPRTFLHNPEVFPALLSLWSKYASVELPSLPLVLRVIFTSSTHNLAAVHQTSYLSQCLRFIQEAKLPESQLNELQTGVAELLQLGISELDDAQVLYGNAAKSPRLASILDQALQTSDGTSFVHFDMSLYGYSCIELPDLGRTFPPPSNASHGYSLSVWFQIISFDPASHTTIFGAFDASQSCFVLVYLEKDSKNLILQTSVTASRPSVRFKSYGFVPGKWYHVCIVHKRQTMTSSSRASLFVDGEFVEQVKSHFPSHPAAVSSSGAESSVTKKAAVVQAFLGTPKDLAPDDGNQSSSQWRLASACLFGEALGDDLIAVYHELGPRYHGNYQDTLGSFQTYEASAVLNLKNETLHPGKEERSTIVAAIRSKAGNLLPENRILLNISAASVIEDEEKVNCHQGHLASTLSKDALRNLRHWTRGGRASIAINAAIPSINKALMNLSGVAFLTGDPAVVVVQPLDDAAWRLGGCLLVGLALVDAAATAKELIRALDIFFATIKTSWRNSEAMERENGFSMLGSMLATKLPKIISTSASTIDSSLSTTTDSVLHDLLMRILTFVGYQPDSPENSVINNPLAYRVLLVDLDIWRTASVTVQQLYFNQFTVFSTGSKHHIFNAKRLSRMRITKKWLIALKSDNFHPETLEHFLTAFRSMLSTSLNAEAHRTLSQYITYALHKPKERHSQLRPTKSVARAPPVFGPPARRSTLPVDVDQSPSTETGASRLLTRCEVGVQVLQMYAELLCQRDVTNIKKFAKTVTNKWLLHLLTEDDPQVVILSMKLLARVLIVSGQAYVDKFTNKTEGFTILQYRLKKWWYLPELWTICFAILFDKDVAQLNIEKRTDLYSLLSHFAPGEIKTVYPAVMSVGMAMLQSALKSIIQSQNDPESPSPVKLNGKHARSVSNGETVLSRSRALSLQPQSPAAVVLDSPRSHDGIKLVHTMTRFLADLHNGSADFRNYAISSPYIQELLFLLFPLIVSTDVVNAETELNSRDSALTFDGQDVVIKPLSRTSHQGAPIVRTTSVEGLPSPESTKPKSLKRGSSYVLITSEEPQYLPSPARLETIASPKKGKVVRLNVSHGLVQEVLELVVSVFSDSILHRKDFAGLKIFLRVPPGFQEHQAYFQSFILRNTISSLENQIRLDLNLLVETRVLTNLQKLSTHLDESVFEGWFIDGSEVVIDFLGGILEHLQRGDIKQLKSVRLCSEAINSMRNVMSRSVLLRLSENDDSPDERRTVKLLQKLSYWQTVLFSTEASQEEFLKLLCYLLYTKLISKQHTVREVAADLWRTILVQKQEETAAVLNRIVGSNASRIASGLEKVLEVDNVTFIDWIDEHRVDLDAIFLGRLTEDWESFTISENRSTESSYKTKVLRRREKLRLWVSEGLARDDVLRRHEISADHWKANIYSSEHLKKQRAAQDQQDGVAFNLANWITLQKDLHRPYGLLYSGEKVKSRLDMTEGRNRMRLRFLPDKESHAQEFKPKRAASKAKKNLEIRVKHQSIDANIAASPTLNGFREADSLNVNEAQDKPLSHNDIDDDFEMIDEPDNENYEDKNRKVMRSLQRGDIVEYVHNASRIVGLEACEGLLIIGKQAFYIMDHYFQRSDGEIVDVWQAPADERDSYMQMISGQSGEYTTTRPTENTHETRSWRWEDILSISKRRFLFRDVGIEVFFIDGESYLLTVVTPKLRDDIYQRLMHKAQSINSGLSSTNPEDLWRIESLRSTEDNTQSFGAKFTNVFTQGTSNPATKKWLRGEISNFQYLMLVNTMAGRTFNDLTQYPVFPWVLADYTSEELDLTNPRSFRDLTKPMGAQSPERQAEFNERYFQFAEMGDENAPPFHYGTHYSTSMIVTGYLIRLQPFVQSYLLLQGGSFDHPDRLFYSIEKAWKSSSKENMSDVRELIPEFFYLPEMFTNGNGYDFGKRQGNAGGIDNVVLPKWAKGDPHIFVAKHREALESEYVSRHLHQWIDLIFGHKQRGEAALEATNVFHHLSYRGARNLDDITDAKDREVTIKIIHNFGQTPHQVFHKAHPAKDILGSPPKRLDNAAESLSRLPFPSLEFKHPPTNLLYSPSQQRLLASPPTRLPVPPNYSQYLEYGFTDHSLRFYQSESNKLIGLLEHVHNAQITAAIFADAKTLITAGADCVISLWTVSASSKSIDLFAKGSLFGHKTSITHLAVAKSFSTLISASNDGTILAWDLNRLSFIRVIEPDAPTSRLDPLSSLSISPSSGLIALSHTKTTTLYTLNGHPLVSRQQTCPEQDERILSLAQYSGPTPGGKDSSTDFLSRQLFFTGHRFGVVNVWSLGIHGDKDGKGVWILEHVRRLDHLDRDGGNLGAGICSILPTERSVWCGDEEGRVWEWVIGLR